MRRHIGTFALTAAGIAALSSCSRTGFEQPRACLAVDCNDHGSCLVEDGGVAFCRCASGYVNASRLQCVAVDGSILTDAGNDATTDADIGDLAQADRIAADRRDDRSLDDSAWRDADLQDAVSRDAALRDAAARDAIPVIDPIVASAQLTSSAGYSYVDLAVDWSRGLAYAASRESTACVAVIDLTATPSPTLLHVIGPNSVPATAAGVCLGVALFNEERGLALTSQGGSTVEVWDLGADPRAGTFVRQSFDSLPMPRRIAVHETSLSIELWVAHQGNGGGVKRYTVDGAGQLAAAPASYSSGCSNNFVVQSGGHRLVTGCYEDNSPIIALDAASMSHLHTFDMTAAGETGLWSGAVSADGRAIFVGGWVSSFFELAAASDEVEQRYRFDNQATYRTAAFGSASEATILFAGTGDRYLETWDASDLAAPRLLTRTMLARLAGEVYGVAPDPVQPRVVVVTNRGDVAILDTTRLAAATTTWPTF